MKTSKIKEQLKELRTYLKYLDKQNDSVSQANVSWHISHTIKIFSSICKSSINSQPNNYIKRANANRTKIKLLGFIPRGLGKSPKAFLDQPAVEIKQLEEYISKSEKLFEEFQSVSKNHYFSHPIFGDLDKKGTLWFLKLHTEHHLKIIRDIVKKG